MMIVMLMHDDGNAQSDVYCFYIYIYIYIYIHTYMEVGGCVVPHVLKYWCASCMLKFVLLSPS